MRTKLRSKITFLFMTCALLLAFPAGAFADHVGNNLDNDIDATLETMNLTAGGSNGIAKIYVQPTQDGINGCNLKNDGSVTVNVSSDNTSVATVSPSSITIDDCHSLATIPADDAVSVTPQGAGSTTIRVTGPATIVNNDNTGTFNYQADFTVNVAAAPVTNNAPTVSTAAADAFGSEGDTLQTSGAFSDPGDTLTLSVPANTPGTFTPNNANGTWTWSLPTNDDVAQASITVTATDSKGLTATDTFDYRAVNANPSATFNSPVQAVDEGSNFNLSLSGVTDAGSADTHEYRFDCGDGSGFGDWSNDSSVQCSAGDGPNTLNVKGQVRDDNGGLSDEYSANVTVNNLPPVVTLAGNNPQNVNENKTGSESYSFTVTDPGADAITSVSADCDADSGTDDGTLQGTEPTVSNKSFDCRFSDGPASALVKVSATDDDGATGSDDTIVNIANIAPTLSNLQVSNASQTACLTGGNTVIITFDVSDPGVDDFTRSVNWGDNTSDSLLSHTYNGAGAYTIKVDGKDSDNAAANQLTADGSNVVSLTYNMSGILSPFNATTPYSTFKVGSTIPVKVSITDCAGTPVQGLSPKVGTNMQNPATPSDPINEAITSTNQPDIGNTMRYSDGIYIFNLSTKNVSFFPDPNAAYWMVVREANSKGPVQAGQVTQQFNVKSK